MGLATGKTRSKGQSSTEYIILIIGALAVAFVALGLLGVFGTGTQDTKIGLSQNYWSTTSPIAVKSWNVKGTQPDAKGNMSLQLAMLVQNPTGKAILIRKIMVRGTNFSMVYSHGSNFAGNASNLSISLAPSEQNMVVLIQESGPAIAQKAYELNLGFTYDGDTEGQVEDGSVPLRGNMEYVNYAQATTPPGTGCNVGQIACNQTGTLICCQSAQICSAGIMCCANNQVACNGACCAGSCISNTCVPAGCQLCGGIIYCLPGGMCPFPDYTAYDISVNDTDLGYGESANITAVTKNSGTGNATVWTATNISIGSAGVTQISVPPLLVGQNSTNSTIFTCSAGNSGWHTITVYSDALNQLSELNKSNNVKTYAVQLHCANSAMPDMVVPYLAANVTSLTIGQAATIIVNTSNKGGAGTGFASATKLFAAGGSGSPLASDTFNIPVLAASGSAVNTTIFNCNLGTLGAFIINASADYSGAVTESNENNNWNNSLVVNCTGPDLIIANLSANVTNLTYGQTANVTITTKNAGGADADASNTSADTAGLTPNPLSPAMHQIPALSPSLTSTKYSVYTCNLSTSGVRTVWAAADNLSLVAETDETNNANSSLAINCSLLALPDIVVPSLTANATTVSYGQAATITVMTKNNGNGSAGASITKVYSNKSASLLSPAQIAIGQLGASQSSTNTTIFACNASTAGVNLITAKADNTSMVTETNETNNANSSLMVACTASAMPDLAIQSVSANATVLGAGQKALIAFVTKNTGTAATAATTMTRILSNLTPNPLSVQVVYISPLAVGANRTNYTNFTCTPSNFGSHRLTVTADVTNAAAESNEFNNVGNGTVISCTAPDLAISGITANATKLQLGQSANITVTTKNIGLVPVTKSSNTTIASSISGAALAPAQFLIGTLGAQQESVKYAQFNCTQGKGGTHVITATADASYDVQETNENNNQNSVQITCYAENISGCMYIDQPGNYTLTADLADFNPVTHICVDIEADDVKVDCNGHSVTTNSAFGDTVGIFTNRSHVTIQNCNLQGYTWNLFTQYVQGMTNYSKIYNINSQGKSCVYIDGSYMDVSNIVASGGYFDGCAHNSGRAALVTIITDHSNVSNIKGSLDCAIFPTDDAYHYAVALGFWGGAGPDASSMANVVGNSTYCSGVLVNAAQGSSISGVKGTHLADSSYSLPGGEPGGIFIWQSGYTNYTNFNGTTINGTGIYFGNSNGYNNGSVWRGVTTGSSANAKPIDKYPNTGDTFSNLWCQPPGGSC